MVSVNAKLKNFGLTNLSSLWVAPFPQLVSVLLGINCSHRSNLLSGSKTRPTCISEPSQFQLYIGSNLRLIGETEHQNTIISKLLTKVSPKLPLVAPLKLCQFKSLIILATSIISKPLHTACR